VDQLAAENLFVRKQLASYLERQVKPRRAVDATRIPLVTMSVFVEWRHLLTVVKPETLIQRHQKVFRLWWRWKSRAPGRPPIPVDLQQLMRR
jgi:putative transposase